MYWPIGLPRIYAASSSKTRQARIFESNDDAESREISDESYSQLGDESITSESAIEEAELKPPLLTPATPLTPNIKRVDHDAQHQTSLNHSDAIDNVFDRSFGQAEKEPILALRISRTGHLFATITATTLTIWQAKASSYLVPYLLLLTNDYKAYSDSSSCHTLPVLSKDLWVKHVLTCSS